MSFIRYVFLAGAFLSTAPAWSATLNSVPMQGGMVMPMISYHAGDQRLYVMMPMEVPQLTPLLVSHPGDQFDPANPWFADLDPSAAGLSFSRRYGFVMDVNSDPLPANTAIWLRKLSGPPELRFYRYSTTPSPGVWQPVFGTAGSSNAMFWNQMMFHPAIAAMPGTNGFTATFDAYLVNTVTGEEMENTSTGPMVFQLTNVPDGRPELNVGMMVAVRWDAAITNYAPEYATSLTAANWSPVTNTPVNVDGQSTVFMAPGDASGKYYRMRKLP